MTQHVLKFFAELQRRKVLRLAAAYVVGAWIVLQVAVALQTAMSLSASFSAAILALLVIGFFVALVLSWFYEITPEGVKRTAPAAGDAPLVKPQTTDLALAGALSLVVIVALVQLFTSSPTTPPATPATTTAEAAPAKPEPPALGDKSIAVLPFANLSPDKENEYFADGLTEEVLNLLASVHDLKVVSRTSSFAFKGGNTPLSEIAKRLGVRYILEGSVRADGDELRITAQLIDVATDTHVWSEAFERNIKNVFAVQDEIAKAITRTLDVELSLAAVPREALTQNLDAFRSFLKARMLFFRRDKGDLQQCVALFNRAIELDPKFAQAHAWLGSTYAALAGARREVDPSKELQGLARQSAQAALDLDPKLARAHAVLAGLARFALDWEHAVASASKAVQLDPTDSAAMSGLGYTLLLLGKFEQATQLLNDAKRIDPVYNFVTAPVLMNLAFAQGDNSTVYALAGKLVERGASPYGHGALAFQARAKGDLKQAEKHTRAMLEAMGKSGPIVEDVVAAVKSKSAIEAAERTVNAEVAKDPLFEPEPVFLVMDDATAFLDALNARLARGDTVGTARWMPFVWRAYANGGPSVRKFKEFMRNAGLVDYWKKHGWPDRCRPKGEDDFECS